ncbi:HEAT repeat domain-containing protein, partial [Mesorhizobium sp. L2C089B000]|uniref:HEAT repeat domain-containing protein n=1 Tax=Mesorhizobium sp. L2C089B000 TaxID=1287120 RepID=UPI0003CFCD34
ISLLRGEEHDELLSAFNECGLPTLVGTQLEKGNGAERIHAAEMLGALRSEDAVADLLSALDRDRSREVRIAVAIALCDIGALPPLVITLRKIGVAGQRSRRVIELFRRFPCARSPPARSRAASARPH